jgi:peptidoglycan/LPS O-acetylase OafA/YrhL
MNRLFLLDSSRGLAALIVVYHHFFSHFHYVFVPLKQKLPVVYSVLLFISNLNVEAVLFFFILSGFCIYLGSHRLDFNRRKNINTYLYKRFKRILPIYLLGLFYTYFIAYIGRVGLDASFSFSNLLGNLLFLQTSKSAEAYWFIPFGGNGPLWSISYEMFYYLFFPVFFLLVNKVFEKFPEQKKWNLSVLSALGLAMLGMASRFVIFTPYGTFLTYFILWYLGVYLAHLYLKKKYDDLFFIILAGFNFVVYLITFYFPSDTLGNLIHGGVLVLMSYMYYRMQGLRNSKLFQGLKKLFNKLFYHLGTGSYAIYIFHFPLLIVMHAEPLWLVIGSLFMLIIMCIYLENKISRFKYSFIKVNYLPIIRLKK